MKTQQVQRLCGVCQSVITLNHPLQDKFFCSKGCRLKRHNKKLTSTTSAGQEISMKLKLDESLEKDWFLDNKETIEEIAKRRKQLEGYNKKLDDEFNQKSE